MQESPHSNLQLVVNSEIAPVACSFIAACALCWAGDLTRPSTSSEQQCRQLRSIISIFINHHSASHHCDEVSAATSSELNITGVADGYEQREMHQSKVYS
jgi:hypothetical protein